MKTIQKTIFIIINLFLVLSISGQIDRSKPPEPGEAPTIQIGDYESFELDNGLKVFIIENHKIPRVSYSMVFDFDPLLEGENTGYIGITSALIGTATTSRTKVEIDEAIDFIGATFNAGATSVYAAALKKHNELLLEIMADVTKNSTFNEEELEKVRKQSLSALAFGKNDPKTIADRIRSSVLYGNDHPYGELETEVSLESVTLEMCEEYYKTYYKPNIAYLVIVGDITKEEAQPLIEKYLGDWEKGKVQSRDYNVPKVPDKTTIVLVDRPTAVQSVISVAYPIELMVGSDESIKAAVMNTVLGGEGFRLFMNLREEHGYTYGAYSRIRSDEYVGHFAAFTDVRNEVTDSAINEILFEMNRLINEPVPQDELDRVKNNRSGRFALSLEDPKTVGRFALNIERYNLPNDFYANYLKKLDSVSVEDVQSMAKKYLKPDNAYIIVVGKADEIADKLKKLSPNGEILYYDEDGKKYNPTAKKIIPEGIDAKTVFENYFEAIGGKDNIYSLQSESVTAKMMMQGKSIDVKFYKKKPNMSCIEIIMNGNTVQKTVYNNGQALMTGMQGTETEFSEERMEDFMIQKEMCEELYFLENDYKMELLPSVTDNGKEAYVVEITVKSGRTIRYFYDTETGLRVKTHTILPAEMGSLDQEVVFLEYVEKDGLIYPSKVKQTTGQQSFEIKIIEYLVNIDLDDEIFSIE